MTDLISRTEAIEAVRSYFKDRLGKSKCDYDEELQLYVLGKEERTMLTYNKGINDKLRSLPSADAEWIKVTEDTPPDFPCLVCDANGNQPFVPMGIVTITDEEHGEWHIDGRLWDSPKVFVDGEWGNQISYGNRIIAWMPLPKPYREGDEE